MYPINMSKRPLIENSQVINVANVVSEDIRKFNRLLTEKGKPTLNLTNEKDIQQLVDFVRLGTTINLRREAQGQVDLSAENKVGLTYSLSNLGKGYVFWFLCNLCGRRARFLYIPANSEIMACRLCHRLSYKKQNKSKGFRYLTKF